MNYNRAIEKRDLAKIDKLNMLFHIETFWHDVGRFTKNVKSDHSIERWYCLAEYRYEELSRIWNKIMKLDKIIVKCNKQFYGFYCGKEYRHGLLEIGENEDILIIRFNEEHTRCKINDGKMLWYIVDEISVDSIVRAIDKGVLEEVEDYKEPKVTVYSIEEIMK